MLNKLKNLIISGKEFLPIVEGGKGIGITDGFSAGHFAKCGAIGTISGVVSNIVNSNGDIVPMILKAKNRLERHLEMLEYGINGLLSQAKRARDIAGNFGRVHINVMWEMGGTEHILNEVLSKAKGLIQGIVCGAGMPYKLGDIAAKYHVNYFPIVSSMRAFKILWKRSFEKTKEWLGAVVYECPWRAGGHNGLSNAEDPFVFGNTYERVKELRTFMNENGLHNTPIIVAGGIWNLTEYENFLCNEEIGNVAFQFGTRPIVTQENPAPLEWKQELLHLKEDEVITNHFSPTGFYSSAVKGALINKLIARTARQIDFSEIQDEKFNVEIIDAKTKRTFYIKKEDSLKTKEWIDTGFKVIKKTPDNTIVFISEEDEKEIQSDLVNCSGCLSQCAFSSWSQYNPDNNYNSGRTPDCRSFCIQKALQYAKKGIFPEEQLHFAGSCATRFAKDEMYKNDYIPTTKELIEAIIEGR